MAEQKDTEKKIIVDEDWKRQIRNEKEKPAGEEKEEKTEPQPEHEQLPQADFAGLVGLFATQAFLAMGVIRAENDKDRKPDMQFAKYNIDMLEVVQQKTKGNLSAEEDKFIEDTLHQLRMIFVKMSE